MATGKGQGTKPEWIDIQLNDKQKTDMKANMPDAEALVLGIQALLERDYAISVRNDAWNSCVAAYITPGPDDAQNRGKILTGRGSSAFSALRGAIYRHFTVTKGVWGSQSSRPIDEE